MKPTIRLIIFLCIFLFSFENVIANPYASGGSCSCGGYSASNCDSMSYQDCQLNSAGGCICRMHCESGYTTCAHPGQQDCYVQDGYYGCSGGGSGGSGGVSAASGGEKVYIWAYANTDTQKVKENTCDIPSGEEQQNIQCSLEGISQKNCCWGANGCNGKIVGDYYSKSYLMPEKAKLAGPTYLFKCIDADQSCSIDDSCIALGSNTEGYCTQGTEDGDKFCRISDPWCGDQYCDQDQNEVCSIQSGFDRSKDAKSLPDDPVCKYYECDGIYMPKDLPAGDYPVDYNGQTYPFANDGEPWHCNYGDDCSHCDGEGECVSSCIDDDSDGYGSQPDPLFHSDCCPAGSKNIDCNDKNITTQFGGNGYFIHPNSGYLETPSPYCDCNSNDGFSEGTYEGPINLALPISRDLCFDGIDNDCDGANNLLNKANKIDCNDPGCSPDGYKYQIRNRTCAGDCTDDYKNESMFDRSCCPNPSDCVLDGRCVQSGQVDGEFPESHYCYNNKWYGADTFMAVCSLLVEDPVFSASTYNHWNKTGNAGNGKCCGDDPNEYFTQGLYGEFACCNQPNMQVIDGMCVDQLAEKVTWDGSKTGYCLSNTDCLVNPDQTTFKIGVSNATDIDNAANNNLRCIHNGEFIGDHYCDNGDWATRTAMVSTELLNFAQNVEDGSLYCDTYANVLNLYTYDIAGNYAENYLGIQSFECDIGGTQIPCTNNVCVLRYKEGDSDRVIIGTSLNQEVNSPVYSILEALSGGQNDCNGQLNSDSFAYCGTGVWYDSRIKSVIYSPDSINLVNVLVGDWKSFIQGVFSPSVDYVSQKTISSYNFNFALGTHNFNKIYLSKKGDKQILIITEEISGKKYMSTQYSGFSTDICSIVSKYKASNPMLVPLDCSVYAQDTYLITGGLSLGYYHLMDDLGPKLRLE